ncbi:hypothetical protein, partial [Aureimonas sp. AU4]|uniref:hypothetical protein n=1 Tax=Aureimonas sp. AU4 TaxID=1638163 RepID=UPI000A5D34AF
WTERDAVDRLHGEGVTPRRIAVRVGVPRHLVDERIAQIEDGTAIRIWIDGLDSGTRKGADVGKDGGSSPQDVGKAE